MLPRAEQLPFADEAFDIACSAFGAIAFVAHPESIMAEVARVLRPGGLWVFATNHPMRWMFPDDPTEAGLTVNQSYFDRTPYVEINAAGRATYVEHHRTLGDRVRDLFGLHRGATVPGMVTGPERGSSVVVHR